MKHILLTALCWGLWITTAAAQTGLNFAGLQQDQSAPLEVSADALSLNQSDGTAIFERNVIIGLDARDQPCENGGGRPTGDHGWRHGRRTAPA
ncbi:MAG: hypothetical protein AAF386_11980 [Pseudomonadota bacterium]